MARRANKAIAVEALVLGVMVILVIAAIAVFKAIDILKSSMHGVFAPLGNALLLASFTIFFCGGLKICAAIVRKRKNFSENNGESASSSGELARSAHPAPLIDQLRKMDWFQFEQLVAHVYRAAGYQVERRGGANADGGIDMILTNGAGQRVAVQCKHWKAWKVNPKTIREFVGAMKIIGIEKGIFITMHGYTQHARRTAAAQNIELVNEDGLARLLKNSDACFNPAIKELLNGSKKLCPKCENELVRRVATKGPNAGNPFWGCSTFPKCGYTMNW